MKSSGLLNSDDLKAWAKIKQDAALRRWLDKAPYPIPWKPGPNGEPCTTLDAVTEALTRRENNGAWEA